MMPILETLSLGIDAQALLVSDQSMGVFLSTALVTPIQ
ncbi:hypothetical protein TR2A62_0826 [Thalassobium sp. R2A62]|nr:hypothetical protein TR2A62_0826 [Thalassobium sp. R2A62]